MVDWDRYRHRPLVDAVQRQIDRELERRDRDIDWAEVERRCRRLRGAYVAEAAVDTARVLRRTLGRAVAGFGHRRRSRGEC